jgi:parallel beta-helix repeat protein
MIQPKLFIPACMLAVTLVACGGGGSSPASPPPNPLFVRASGNDANSGADAAHALQTISRAAEIARDNYKIIVGPGTYNENVTTTAQGGAPQGLIFIADTAGTRTGDPPNPVVVNAAGTGQAGFKFSNSSGTLIDGFTITGAVDAGIVIKSHCDDFVIQDCVIFNNNGDGIRIQDSANVLIFNNLVYANSGKGIGVGTVATTAASAPNADVINNTIFGNGDRGITVGNSTIPSMSTFVRNNIVQNNGIGAVPTLENIKVFAPPTGYDEDFCLVAPPTYLPANLAGKHDVGGDAVFVDAGGGNFHLHSNSPALNAGDSLGGLMTTDFTRNKVVTLKDFLADRTTTGIGCDQSAVDMGFHYPLSRCTSP